MAPSKQAVISDAEMLARLRLIRSENVGPVTFRHLLNRYKTAQAALQALPEIAARGGMQQRIRICSAATANADITAIVSLVIVLWHGKANRVRIKYPHLLSAVRHVVPCSHSLAHLMCALSFLYISTLTLSRMGIMYLTNPRNEPTLRA